MTNGEKYKSINERVSAFRRYCAETECLNCCIKPYEYAKHTMCVDRCILKWLALEAEEEKLLPCPFCGGEAKLVVNNPITTKGAYVQCTRCWAFVTGFNTEYAAIAAWNRRVK